MVGLVFLRIGARPPVMPPKDTDEPTTLSALGAGLSTADTPRVTPWERWGPMVAFVAYVACILLLAFDFVPNPSGIVGLVGLLGPIVGAWAAKLGATNR